MREADRILLSRLRAAHCSKSQEANLSRDGEVVPGARCISIIRSRLDVPIDSVDALCIVEAFLITIVTQVGGDLALECRLRNGEEAQNREER